MIKKITIIILSIFLLFGCHSNDITPIESTPEQTKDPIIYGTYMNLVQIPSFELFDSIYVSDLDQLNDVLFKTSIFDETLRSSLQLGSFDLNLTDSLLDEGVIEDNRMLYYLKHIKVLRTKVYVEEYLTQDFSNYLTSSFHEDMQKLEDNEMTADQFFSTYGTHIVLAVNEGYQFHVALSIESNDLTTVEMLYLKDYLITTNPILFPITDPTFLSYEPRSRIQMEIISTQQGQSIEQVLNAYHTNSLTIQNQIEENCIIPIYRVFGWNDDAYPNAIAQLAARYDALFEH